MTSRPTAIQTPHAAPAIGPYSQAVRAGQLLFVSGQIPVDPVTGDVVSDDIAQQTTRVIQNLTSVLEAAGGSLRDVVRTTVFLTDLADFAAMNTVYASNFDTPAPARSTVEVSALPKSVRIEVDAIAVLSDPK